MCSPACIDFGCRNITYEEIHGKRVLEIGSLNFNGTLRNSILENDPVDYIGVDLVHGEGVDVICRAENLLGVYGESSFDVIISTETLEHIFEWKKVINDIKTMCCHGGSIIITTRSYGFPSHGWPDDHWRFETYDMKYIFSDFKEHGTLIVEKDNADVGVFVKAVKPVKPIDFRRINIDDYRLYNIVYDLRI